MEQQPEKRSRARKYHTEEERRAAQLEANRRYQARMRESEPERFKQMMDTAQKKYYEKCKALRTLVREAEAEGGARLEEKEVVEAREFVAHLRAKDNAKSVRRYNTNPEFRERHKVRMAEYDRRKRAERRLLESPQ